MKFNKTHLFFIILAVALLSTLGFTIKEGLTNKSSRTESFWRERRGVSRRDIKPGEEDLYVLKSSIVPPVCPKCPQRTACPRQKPCPPCPPCARCPEPAFTCKKVPNYNSMNNQYLPLPWLSQGQGRL